MLYLGFELLSPHLSKGFKAPGLLVFTNFKSGFSFTLTIDVLELTSPFASVTVKVTVKFFVPQPSAVKVWLGLLLVEVDPSPKFQLYL